MTVNYILAITELETVAATLHADLILLYGYEGNHPYVKCEIMDKEAMLVNLYNTIDYLNKAQERWWERL